MRTCERLGKTMSAVIVGTNVWRPCISSGTSILVTAGVSGTRAIAVSSIVTDHIGLLRVDPKTYAELTATALEVASLSLATTALGPALISCLDSSHIALFREDRARETPDELIRAALDAAGMTAVILQKQRLSRAS